ncbi:hypothetical protein FRC07_011295 [Ceratobasidium sp. 392]|nr:hypothetical protein FRC07_011295 [Ceratobasidium sp. 392]
MPAIPDALTLFEGYATAVAGDMMSVEELEDARQDEDVEDEEDEENEDARSDTTVLSVGPHAQV